MEAQNCISGWAVVLYVVGTFITTIILMVVSTYFFRRWRRNKGRHLVLVTRPEIVEDAYAFDNPCFKEAVIGSNNKSMERPQLVSFVETPANDSPKWSSPWSLLASGSSNKHDNRRTLDDSILLPTATRVCVVSLRSRDFTGLGFNVCGNMREGIFVKDLLHRGPASESGRIHPGDRIASVKISFRSMVYEDALTILSYASPYDVEIEVESGGTGSRPTTLLKKTVGPSPTRLCHPLYRSQSTPEFSRCHKTSAKRLIIPHPNEPINTYSSTADSTSPKSIKSTPDSHTLKKRIAETQPNHHKIGIKVLPSLDGVHRIVDQNEHNTNLERRNSKKNDTTSTQSDTEKFTQHRNNRERNNLQNSANEIDNYEFKKLDINHTEVIVTDVPAEVHNAAIAARRNRKSSSEYLDISKNSVESQGFDDSKNSQKNKKKTAPAPPNAVEKNDNKQNPDDEDSIESIVDCTDESSKKVYDDKIIEIKSKHEDIVKCQQRSDERDRDSESESDSEMQHSLTTIELNPADITIHHTPRPDADGDHVDDDIYRKAASLGDLSKYENKSTVIFMERAQSLDMGDNGLKKRKAPMPPDDIIEITEDLTKLDELENGGRFDGRKLKKSDEWGTLEDALWETTNDTDTELPVMNKKSNGGTLERSVSAVEMKIKDDNILTCDSVIDNKKSEDSEIESFVFPSDKHSSKEFVRIEAKFDPNENKILARIVDNVEAVELDPDEDRTELSVDDSDEELGRKSVKSYMKGLDFDKIKNGIYVENKSNMKQEVYEEPINKITISSRLVEYKKRDEDERRVFEQANELSEAREPDLKVFEIVRKQNELEKNKENQNIGCDLEANVTIDERNTLPTNGDNENISNICISSGENSEDNGLANGKSDDLKKTIKSPQATTHRSEKIDFITEIKVSSAEMEDNDKLPQQKSLINELIVTSNDGRSSGKKPPVPPRRSDSTKSQPKDNSSDKQVVYVSQVKSPDKNQNESSMESPNDEIIKKDFVNWIYTSDKKEQNPWGNDSNQSQSVTNIVVTSGDKTQL